MLASSPAAILNHIHTKKGIPFRFLQEQKDSRGFYGRLRLSARVFMGRLWQRATQAHAKPLAARGRLLASPTVIGRRML